MLVGQQIGPFAIEKELGSGAMGVVYRAVYTKTGQPVALKVISGGALNNESALARFEREAEVLKQLRHPNIVRWLGSGRYKGTPFFAMEMIAGESLDHTLARRGRFTWEEVVSLGQQLCSALQHAHEKGIIHRDLKPSNLMVTSDGTLKLTDFGIAKDLDMTNLTGTHCTVGTAAYMSPEQCQGKPLTTKSDLYSLGVVLYELLTGQKPFVAESPIEVFMMHVSADPVRPARRVLDIPPWLDTLVCQLMEKSPEHRPLDAATAGRALEEVRAKVEAQKSAGAELANVRRADRTGMNTTAISDGLDDTDRAAARALRAGKRKPKEKPKAWHEQTAVRAAGLAMALLALIGLAVMLLKPPPSDVLYEQAEAAMKASDPDAARAAVDRYLAAYGRRNDERTTQVRTWDRDLLVAQRTRSLHKRYRTKFHLSEVPYDAAAAALDVENEGDLERAQSRWKELRERYADHADPEERIWADVAAAKLAILDQVGVSLLEVGPLERQLLLQLDRPTGPAPTKASDSAESDLLTALRLERFGDKWEARDRFERLVRERGKEPDDRPLVLLAAKKFRRLQREAPLGSAKEDQAARRAFVAARLDEIKSLRATKLPQDTLKAKQFLRDIIELYRSDADAELAMLAAQAAELEKSEARP